MNILRKPFHFLRWEVIHQFDPAAVFLQRTIRTVAALALSVLIFRQYHGLIPWAALSPVIMSWAREGSTIRARKGTMAATALVSAALVIPATVLGHNLYGITDFMLAATFVAFYINVLGISQGTVGRWSLFFCVLAMVRPDSALTGCIRASVVLAGGALAYATHFLVFPLRPKRVLSVAITDLNTWFQAMAHAWQQEPGPGEKGPALKKRAHASVNRFSSLPDALHLTPKAPGTRGPAPGGNRFPGL